ncbi:hypothetical protein AS593_00570 [Caulobacter vibrioides]|nr:hypothetical protein AS593_00570 [Caulobacter vibrioides]
MRVPASTLLAALLCAASSPALACTVSANVDSTVGPYSPGAVKGGAVPALGSLAGLQCPTSVVVLLGTNYIKANFSSANGLKLLPAAGGGSIAYVASADPAGSVVFAQNATVDYMQNNLLNVLGLLGGSSASLPIYVKPSSAALVPEGTYSDTITVKWDWSLCPGIGVGGLCVGQPDKGTGTTTLKVHLVVTAKAMTLTVASATTWDPLNGASSPKSLPGSRQRSTVHATNPDIVPLDKDTVAVVLRTPAHARVAFDGDGASSTFVKFTDGSPASGLTTSYASPASTTDDVDFSSDGGATWTYVPAPADPASVAAVNAVRVRMKGAMTAQSTFSVSAPYQLD